MKWLVIAAAAAGTFPWGAARAEEPSHAEVQAEERRLDAEYAAARTACDRQTGNARELCLAASRALWSIARAQLLHASEPSLAHENGVRVAQVEATYDIALQRCDDPRGAGTCVREAKDGRARALAEARRATIEANAAANEKVFDERARATADRR